MFEPSEPYSPRPVELIELLERDGWRIKLYSIIYGAQPLERGMYAEAIETALRELPRPAATAHRPGVGFAICHQGRGWHYLVMNWWDNENELPQHIYVRPRDANPETEWRRSAGSESVCVWDIQIISFERDAYVKFVLTDSGGADLEAYLATHISSAAPPSP